MEFGYSFPLVLNFAVQFSPSSLPPTDPHGIQSSKTTGEPPLVLANSVFFAIKQAVAEARKEAGVTGPFTFDSPATVQRIQRACAVKQMTSLTSSIH